MHRNWSKAFRQGNVVYKLNILGNAAIKTVDDRFVDIVGLDIRTVRVLRLIGDNPGIGFAEIVTLGALERSLASRLIQALVRGGYVERRNDENDARRFGLFLTANGIAARKRADLLSDIGLDIMFKKFDPTEVETFVAMLDKLAGWLDSDEFERLAGSEFEKAAHKATSM